MQQHIILVLMWIKARKLQGTKDPKFVLLQIRTAGFTVSKSYLNPVPWEGYSTMNTSVSLPSLSPPTPSFPSSFSLSFLKCIFTYCKPSKYQGWSQVLGKQQWSCLGSWAAVSPPPWNFFLLWIKYYGCKFAYQMASPHSSSRYVITGSPGN